MSWPQRPAPARAAGGQGKPGRAGYWQTAGLRDVSQMEMQPETRAVKLQGKPLPSPQKETGYAKVTKMTKNNEVSQGIWLLFFCFDFFFFSLEAMGESHSPLRNMKCLLLFNMLTWITSKTTQLWELRPKT